MSFILQVFVRFANCPKFVHHESMNALSDWLQSNGIKNPHCIPYDLQDDFQRRFGAAEILWPQPGGQEAFQSCPADICFYGGEAGAGKSWSLLFDHLKWIDIPGYNGVIVRKEFSQIFGTGGLWTEAMSLYLRVRGTPKKGDTPKFKFPCGAEVAFKHSQHADKVEMYWQGLSSPVISIDEITQFKKSEFLYIMSRNRSMTGINPYIRATCNPDPSSWVRDFIGWWIGPDGYVIEERCGIIRWFLHRDDSFVWADTREELIERFGEECNPLSFTFIRGHLSDNKKLLEIDPQYKSKLDNLPESERRALSEGNWNELDNPTQMFLHKLFNAHRVEKMNPAEMRRIVVGIDPAGSTSAKSDETGIIIAGLGKDGHGYIFADYTGKYRPQEWAKIACDKYDLYHADRIVAERNYGGDMVESTIVTHRPDVRPRMVTATRGKAVRAEPVAALYEKGMIHHVGFGLKPLENELAEYRPGQAKSPNRMDALVWCITDLMISQPPEPRLRML
jgi:hypothetical protein